MNHVWFFRFFHTGTTLFTNSVSAVETTISQYLGNFVYLSQNRALLIVYNSVFLHIFNKDSIGIPFGAL